MIIIFETFYLVTTVDCKRQTIAQHLASDKNDAGCLANDIIAGICKGKTKNIANSIIEITAGEINNIMGDGSKQFIAKRNPDEDDNLFQIYDGGDTTYFISAKTKGDIDTILNIEQGGKKYKPFFIRNKINYRGVTRVNMDGTETKITFTDYHICEDCGRESHKDELVVEKIK